ncbi:MAG TPA: hypothetical protein VFD58_09875 [Blastocatellia bacterium]|nr:hypothetical protein [Blastocatellia bacterium]
MFSRASITRFGPFIRLAINAARHGRQSVSMNGCVLLICVLVVCLLTELSVEAADPGNPAGTPAAGAPASSAQRYRAGLRNSIDGHPLKAQEQKAILESLRNKTGFMELHFDEAGFLVPGDQSRIAGGSKAARELLLAAIEGRKSLMLQSYDHSSEIAFARLGTSVVYISYQTRVKIETQPIEIDFADFKHLRGEKEVLAAFDLGFVLLHELCHAALELHDPEPGAKTAGDCEEYVNRIRREMGLPERQNYVASTRQVITTPTRGADKMAELVFAQVQQEEKDGTRGRQKTFYLTWEIHPVGEVRPHQVAKAEPVKTGAVMASAP